MGRAVHHVGRGLQIGLVGGAAVLMLLVAGVIAWSIRDQPHIPSAWDARVAPIADFVEKERGLEFDHPVEIEFLSPAEYRKAAISDDEQLTDEDRAALRDTVAQLRALGLVSGNVDLEAASDELADTGTLAFYDPDTKKVSIRGTELTPAVRATLAHELTHAVQDQHVDLGRLDDLEGEEGDALRAIGEGDADRIEDAYVDTMSDDDLDAYDAEQQKADEETASLDEKVPQVLQSLFAAPYAFGDQLVSILAADGGNGAVDKALRHPPKSSEVLLDPGTYGTDAAEPKDVSISAPDGVDELDDGTLGPIAWYLMLSRRIDPLDALAAADGWGGDHYVLYRDDDGRTCIDVAYEGDTSDDVDEMHDALDEWIAAGDEGDASVETTTDGLRFHACDPGEEADTAGGDGSDDEALGIAVTRAQIYDEILGQGATKEQASCFAEGVLDRFSTDQLLDEQGEYIQSDEGQAEIEDIATSCR